MSFFRRAICAVSAALLLGAVAEKSFGQSPSPTPTPPPWQQEADTLRLLEFSTQATPARDPSEAAARDVRLDRLYHELADKYPDRVSPQKAAGDRAQRRGRPLEAITYYQRAQTLEPGDADSAETLGTLSLQLGHTRDAADQFRRAVAARPDDARLHYHLGNTLYLFRHQLIDSSTLPDAGAVLNLALAELRRAAELAPTNLDYAQGYAETFYMAPDPDWAAARRAWEAVRELSGPDRDLVNLHLARVSLRMKHPEDAEGYLLLIQNPQFTLLKDKLRAQAASMTRPSAPEH